MRRFTEGFLVPYIVASGYRRLCEIGSQGGSNIDRLLGVGAAEISVIDPCIDSDLEGKYAANPRVDVKKGLSLDMLAAVTGAFDCIMIDGDHNWYTVYHELQMIHERQLLAPDGTIFLHDVCWPYARRDMYYDLDTVPAEYRQPVARKGILRGASELSDDPSRGKNGELWNAQHEGGSRNGVLTAVEDFLREHPDTYRFFSIKKEWGLGVIVRKGENSPVVNRLRLRVAFRNAWAFVETAVRRIAGRLEYQAR